VVVQVVLVTHGYLLSRNQQEALRVVSVRQAYGATWLECSRAMNVHHGVSSGALSILHKHGRLEMLRAKRQGSHVYVLPMYVMERATVPRRVRRSPTVEDRLAGLLEALEKEPSSCPTRWLQGGRGRLLVAYIEDGLLPPTRQEEREAPPAG
jgi:hypothetical protein